MADLLCRLCGEFSGHGSSEYVTDHELIHMEQYWGREGISSGDPIRLIRSLREARATTLRLADLLDPSDSVSSLVDEVRQAFRDCRELPADRDQREAIYLALLDVAESTTHLVALCDAAGVRDGQRHAKQALARLSKVLRS